MSTCNVYITCLTIIQRHTNSLHRKSLRTTEHIQQHIEIHIRHQYILGTFNFHMECQHWMLTCYCQLQSMLTLLIGDGGGCLGGCGHNAGKCFFCIWPGDAWGRKRRLHYVDLHCKHCMCPLHDSHTLVQYTHHNHFMSTWHVIITCVNKMQRHTTSFHMTCQHNMCI